jgi:hypothetical protein
VRAGLEISSARAPGRGRRAPPALHASRRR